ncbi:Rrf2 family transcriptional regulator [Spirochaetia bacterium]|nr:Rrf2 family transcriptional regulator [Spirochaetia bacterium]
MKISTRGRYGIRLLIDLAEQTEASTTLSSIAARQKISVRYLEQVAIILRRSGFIHSIKGSKGGYKLARPPAEINIGAVLRALEGDMLIVDPPVLGVAEGPIQSCIRAVVFEPVNRRIAEIIDSITLESLLGASVSDDEAYMYFI